MATHPCDHSLAFQMLMPIEKPQAWSPQAYAVQGIRLQQGALSCGKHVDPDRCYQALQASADDCSLI